MAGRHTKKTDARVLRVLEAIRDGNSQRAAAAYAGISDETLRTWLHADLDFLAAFTRAEADSERELVGFIRNAAASDWKAAAHLLACRWPDTWSQRARIEIDVRSRAQQLAQAYGLDAAAIVAEAEQWLTSG